MVRPDPAASRPEILLGALIYLMSTYQRKACPRLACSIASHLDCLAAHPHVDPVIRNVCAGITDEWRHAGASLPHNIPLH